MPNLIKITSDISFKRNDISIPMKNKEDTIPISEYNRFIGKSEKELQDRLKEIIRAQKLIHVLKSKVRELEEENSLESKACQIIINQINLLEQLNKRSSSLLVQVNRSLNYIDPKESISDQEENIKEKTRNSSDMISIKNSNRKEGGNYNKDILKINQTETIEDTKNKVSKKGNEYKSKNNLIDNNQKVNYNNENSKMNSYNNKPLNTNFRSKFYDKRNKKKNEDNINQTSKLTNKKGTFKSKLRNKTKHGINTSKTNNKLRKRVSVTVINSPVIQKVIQKFKETKIKINSHESDFSPPYHVNKNYIKYGFH